MSSVKVVVTQIDLLRLLQIFYSFSDVQTFQLVCANALQMFTVRNVLLYVLH